MPRWTRYTPLLLRRHPTRRVLRCGGPDEEVEPVDHFVRGGRSHRSRHFMCRSGQERLHDTLRLLPRHSPWSPPGPEDSCGSSTTQTGRRQNQETSRDLEPRRVRGRRGEGRPTRRPRPQAPPSPPRERVSLDPKLVRRGDLDLLPRTGGVSKPLGAKSRDGS